MRSIFTGTLGSFFNMRSNIPQVHRNPIFWISLIGSVLLIIIGIGIGASLFGKGRIFEQLGYWTNLYTEAMSIAVTVTILDLLNRRRSRIETLDKLVKAARSPSSATAVPAIDELRDMGLLKGENSVLRGRNMRRADLYKADFYWTDLHRVDLEFSDLRLAIFWGANLREASLIGANLTQAKLGFANLQNASLEYADLKGASLRGANLKNAKLDDAIFSEETLLPDAKDISTHDRIDRNYDKFWTPETDITKYTDPNHPEFWQPEWAAAGFDSLSEYEETHKG